MHHTIKIALAALLLATTTLTAEAGRLQGPSTSPAGIDPITTSSSGEIDSPGDAFVPWNPEGKPERRGPFRPFAQPQVGPDQDVDAPHYEAECRYSDQVGKFVTVTWVNTGTETIPAGTLLIGAVDAAGNGPDVVLKDDLKPGDSVEITINVAGDSYFKYPGKPCDVWLYAGTGPLPTHPL